MPGMRRREFVSLFGGAAVAATLRAHPLKAQQSGRIYRIGFFGGALPASTVANNVMDVGYPRCFVTSYANLASSTAAI